METLQELNKLKNKAGLVSGSLRINEYDNIDENISASINPKNWEIQINLRKDYNPIEDRRQKAYARKKNIKDAKKTLLEDILLHELAHWELPFNSNYGCPYDIYHHDLILESVKNALPKDKKSLTSYVANAFEDLMINPRVKEFNGSFSGQTLFWDNEGKQLKEKGGSHYTPFYEAFVKLNMHLFGDNTDTSLLKRHYSNSNEVNQAVKQVIKQLGLSEKIKDTSILFNRNNWPGMAEKFTKAITPLLETPPLERLSAYKASDDSSQQEKKSGNGIEQKLAGKEGKEEVSYGRYNNNNGLSPNIQSFEQLDALYRKLARAIPINVEAMTREKNMKIAPLAYRPFDEDKDDIMKVKPSKLFIEDDGITFAYPSSHIIIRQKSKVQKHSFPDFKMMLLDNSGSMKEGIDGYAGNTSFIPWGDNSKYHYALLGFYGIEQFLQMQGIAQYIGHGLSLFSSSTRYKESDFKNVRELRKLALSPEFGETYLGANTLLDALKGRESFVLSISDGEIANWQQEKSSFYDMAKNNYFAHIQIGSQNSFTKDLESNDLPVFYVQSGKDLSRLMVNIATDTYKRHIAK